MSDKKPLSEPLLNDDKANDYSSTGKSPIDGEEQDSDDDVMAQWMGEVFQPHCCGHQWHYVEGLSICVTLGGMAVLMIDTLHLDVLIPELVCGIAFLIAALVGTVLIWDLASIKRLAATAEVLRKDAGKFKAQNKRAQSMQEEKRKQDKEMKDRLNEMKQAELVLAGSANNLKGIAKQEKELVGEAEEMLEKRQELAKMLLKQIDEMGRQAISTSRSILRKRAIMYFKGVDEDGDGMKVHGEEWKELQELMRENGVELNVKAAGNDGTLDISEFRVALDAIFDDHFPKLEKAHKKNEQLKIAIRECSQLLA